MTSKRAVLFDALGTLVELDPPAPNLVEEIRRRWQLPISLEEAERAFAAEMRYYKAHHVEGRDGPSLDGLRQRCARVLHDSLPAHLRDRIPAAEIGAAMLASIRFQLYADVPDSLRELRAAGVKLAVVSNWDVSLADVLDDLGVARLLDFTLTSAQVGAAKPDPAIFLHALEKLEVPASDAVHVGDSPALDLVGAEAAGIEAILIHRGDHALPETVADPATIGSLSDLL